MKQNCSLGTLVTSLFVVAVPLSAAAQEKPITTNKEMENTVKVVVTGESDLNYVWRRAEVTAFTGGVSGTSSPGTTYASENTFEGFVALRLSVDLSDKISTVMEFGTKRVDGGVVHFFNGTQGGANPNAQSLQLREAHVTLNEFLMPELSVQMGISTWLFDLRGAGTSMAFDPRHSHRFNRNLATPAGVLIGNTADGAATLGYRAHDPEELEPMGIWVRYSRETLAFDVVALPAVVEGGAVTADEAFYALDLLYKLDSRGSQIGLIASLTSEPGGASTIITFGGGADYKAIDNLDAYGEIYFNRGRVATVVLAEGYAYQIGVVFSTGGGLKSWIGLNWTYYSGDGSLGASNQASAFSGYENNHDLLILEDMYTGYNWDSNLRVIKVSGGLALNAGGLNNLKLSLIAGFSETAKAVQFPALGTATRRLGNELDAKAEWDVTKQVAVNFGIGFLFGSKVLQDSMAPSPGAKMETILFTLGTNLKF